MMAAVLVFFWNMEAVEDGGGGIYNMGAVEDGGGFVRCCPEEWIYLKLYGTVVLSHSPVLWSCSELLVAVVAN